jgi:NTP pyrophosphatase (non-canonical NTP hydrolase)
VTITTHTAPKHLSNQTLNVLRDLQEKIGAANAAKGFHDRGDHLRARLNPDLNGGEWDKGDEDALRDYTVARLALITTEVAEAIEEVRSGRGVTETYYSGGTPIPHSDGTAYLLPSDPRDADGNPRKPEGVPSELADIVIRTLDLADEWEIDLAAVIDEKLAFNAKRARMHGRTM